MSVETCPYCDAKGITYGPRVAERKKCRTCGGTGIVITCSFLQRNWMVYIKWTVQFIKEMPVL